MATDPNPKHNPDDCPVCKFAHLHQHTQFSLLDGAARIKDLLKWVKKVSPQDPMLAMTDHGNMFGAVNFYKYATEYEVKPIIGYEAYVAADSRFDRKAAKGVDGGYFHLTLLAQNMDGYQNLCRLSSMAYLEGFYQKPRIDREILREYNQGVIALSGCLGAEIPQFIMQERHEDAEKRLQEYLGIFGSERYFIEIQDHGLEEQHKVNKVLKELADKYGLGIVATNDGHYVRKEDAEAHAVVLAVQSKATWDDPNRWKFPCDEFYVKSPDEMVATFSGEKALWGSRMDELFDNSVHIGKMCNVELVPKKVQYRIPKFPLPEGRTEVTYYRELTFSGLLKRYPDKITEELYREFLRKIGKPVPHGDGEALALELAKIEDLEATRAHLPELKDKMDWTAWEIMSRAVYELTIIERMGFPGYLLIVGDFINWAKDNGISVGPGRGSAAGSLATYATRITNIDPLAYDLLFERFLNPARVSMPDIDTDFSDVRRGEVIEYTRQRYGDEMVAQIGTFGTLASKAAIKDAARVFGLPIKKADELAKLIPVVFGKPTPLDKAIETIPDLRAEMDKDPLVKRVIEVAQKLEGLNRQSSVHAAGVVISDVPIRDHIPLMRANDGVGKVTQYDMGSVEALGFLKMDFLGLRTLSFLDESKRIVKESKGVDIDFDTIPIDDEKTFEVLGRGETKGVFQLDSAGMTSTVRGLKPRRIQDIIALGALYRPGPMENIPTYIRRHHGREAVEYPQFPNAEQFIRPILEETYGIPVYQEQIMQIASAAAGYSLGEADLLRRCIAAGTLITNAETGQRIPIEEVEPGFKLLTLAPDYKLVQVEVQERMDNGVMPVYRLKTRSGRNLELTAEHPLLTVMGWKHLCDLKVGNRIAVLTPQAAGLLNSLKQEVGEVPMCPPCGSLEPQQTASSELNLVHAANRISGVSARGGQGEHTGIAPTTRLQQITFAVVEDTDVFWDAIISIEFVGEKQVYDLAVPPFANFVAADVIVHNSMGKKKMEEMQKHRITFKEGAAAKEIPGPEADALFDLLEAFANYGFNKCVTGNTLVTDAYTGRQIKVIDIVEGREKKVCVPSLDEANLKVVPRSVVDAFPSGKAMVYRLTTETGRVLEATDNHPLYTPTGWKNLGELTEKDFVAVPRHLPFRNSTSFKDHELVVLGYALSEGNLCHPSGFYVYGVGEGEIQDYTAHLTQFENTTFTLDRSKSAASVYTKRVQRSRESEATRFLRDLGVLGLNALNKHVPAAIFGLSREQIALFLGRLWTGDGGVQPSTRLVFYATSSEKLARDVQHLLLRLGLQSRIHNKIFKYRDTERPGYTVHLLGGVEATRKFGETVGQHLVGKRKRDLEAVLGSYRPDEDVRFSKDVIPNILLPELEAEVRRLAAENGQDYDSFVRAQGFKSGRDLLRVKAKGNGLSRKALSKLAAQVESLLLERHANAEIYWDRVVSVEPVGVQEVYDLTVEGTHSFVANDIVVHNSHSAAYAVLTYQTAYVKAHYPVEFHAALLSVERGDSDKVAEYIRASRAIGVEVLPPRINQSGFYFSAVGETVLFGLSAVKNVGEHPTELILKEREKGRFKSLPDFLKRVDPTVANKRVVESLIKSGAFDEFGQRGAMLAAFEEMLKWAQAERDQASSGMMSLFGESQEPALPGGPTLDAITQLRYEKEALGIYVTGHPLERYEGLREAASCTIEDLPTCYNEQKRADRNRVRLVLAGMVEGIVRKPTKSGGMLIRFNLSDETGAMEIVGFGKAYDKISPRVSEDGACLVVVEVEPEAEGEGLRVVAQDVFPHHELEGMPKIVELELHLPLIDDEKLLDLRSRMDEYAGKLPVQLKVRGEGGTAVVEAREVKLDEAIMPLLKELDWLEARLVPDREMLLGWGKPQEQGPFRKKPEGGEPQGGAVVPF